MARAETGLARRHILGAIGVAVVAVVALLAFAWRPAIAPIAPPSVAGFQRELIDRGEMLAGAGNCIDCHTAPGGQRQRIGIARALALSPKLIICDEPVSALDVSVRAQVINLLEDLKGKFGVSYLFISHDLSVVEHIADRVAVMYLGTLVEVGGRDQIWRNPQHPYTKALLAAAPIANPKLARARQRTVLQGELPSPIEPPAGCPFHSRCPMAQDRCKTDRPELRTVGSGALAACHFI